ncbi:hypothetical protein FDF40_03690 [Clostridium sporogenes]|uniref:hypothetical protein n=1 Tax=Bacillota TaxID=1239 RepID=UPI0011BE5A95|nr:MULTISPECIES: hypothetical protein [Bacillota]NFT30579.1 hypothetical protein [Clostridium sporogenes]GIN25540.1 hypothetical protein J31TS2_21200 [Bacillus licheniformis]GIN29721.1 hypothetical protein J2TS5_17600 [Bacillus licheniformis]
MDLYWIHQYANYLNTLVNDLFEYGETSDLGESQANDLIECLPNYVLKKERDGKGLFTVYAITYDSNGYQLVTGIKHIINKQRK